MNIVNYQKELEKIIDGIKREDIAPSLLLHSCCAPCSSYVIEYLSQFFNITVLYFNPNIYPESEYIKRKAEQVRLINEMPVKNRVLFTDCDYDSRAFYDAVRGYEQCKEGGERCFICYELRMRAAAQAAEKGGFDYFCTTLSISPLKNAAKINETGFAIQAQTGVKWLPSDFKKRGGYQRSTELSREYGLYRQNFCGCIYSKKEKCDE